MDISVKPEYERVIDNCAQTLADIKYNRLHNPDYDVEAREAKALLLQDTLEQLTPYEQMVVMTKAEHIYSAYFEIYRAHRIFTEGQRLRAKLKQEQEQSLPPPLPLWKKVLYKIRDIILCILILVLLFFGFVFGG